MPRGGRRGGTEQDCTGKSPVHTSNHPARLVDSLARLEYSRLSMHPCNVRAIAESCRARPSVVALEGTRSVCLLTSLRVQEQTKYIIKNNTHKFITEENASKGTEYITYFHNNATKPWFYKKKLPRKIITTINQYRSGYYSSVSSLAKIGLASNSKCECGNELQDINHIFWQCPLRNEQRHDFVADLNICI